MYGIDNTTGFIWFKVLKVVSKFLERARERSHDMHGSHELRESGLIEISLMICMGPMCYERAPHKTSSHKMRERERE